MNFILTLSNFIFPLITFPYVSRVLGAQGVGAVQFATSNVTYFVMLAMLGIPTYGIRACAKVRHDRHLLSKTVQEILWLNALVAVVAYVGLALTIAWVPQFHQQRLLYWLLSLNIVLNLIGVEWLYKGTEQYTYITIRSIAAKLLGLILMFWWVHKPEDYVIYGLITVIGAFGLNVLNFLNLPKLIDCRVIPLRRLDFKPHIKPILRFFLLTVSATIYLNLDTTLLGFIQGDRVVGYYSAAIKIKQILVSIVTSLGVVLLPRLSYYFEHHLQEEFKTLTQKALDFVLLIALPISLYFIFFAKESILFLSGSDYLAAVLPMQLILPAVLFIGLSNLTGIQILVPTNREMLVVYSTLVGAVVDLVLNVIAIPLWGAAGAALSGCLAEAMVLFVQIYFLRDLVIPMFKRVNWLRLGLALILPSFLMIVVRPWAYHLSSQWHFGDTLAILWVLVVTAGLYFLVYGLVLLGLKHPLVMELLDSVKIKVRRD
ncbi:flippase [Vaginisenegalia massiliensis]|uniref:flippase n=1 Tax=Vaginisenegalia massiliensis TaxID=2058294 RepID=UPI000F53336B|nr:flippase [Vaginisenegalia massiliensis]